MRNYYICCAEFKKTAAKGIAYLHEKCQEDLILKMRHHCSKGIDKNTVLQKFLFIARCSEVDMVCRYKVTRWDSKKR